MATADHHIKICVLSRKSSVKLSNQRLHLCYSEKPTHPETGYGHIECGEPHGNELPSLHLKKNPIQRPERHTSNLVIISGIAVCSCWMLKRTQMHLKNLNPAYIKHEQAYQNASRIWISRSLDCRPFGKSLSFNRLRGNGTHHKY